MSSGGFSRGRVGALVVGGRPTGRLPHLVIGALAIGASVGIALGTSSPGIELVLVFAGGVVSILIGAIRTQRVFVDDSGITAVGMFGRRRRIDWSDIGRVSDCGAHLVVDDRHGAVRIVVTCDAERFPELVELIGSRRNDDDREERFPTTFVRKGPALVVAASGLAFATFGVVEWIRYGTMSPGLPFFFVMAGVAIIVASCAVMYRLTLLPDAIRLSALFRTEEYGRDEVVAIRWVTTRLTDGVQLVSPALRLRNGRDVDVGGFGDRMTLYRALRRWRKG